MILIKAAKIIDPKGPLHEKIRDLFIKNGTLDKIASNINEKELDGKVKVIKQAGLCVSIGWIDTSVSLGEPGFEERETIDNGLKTAAASGFTHIVLNPDYNPVPDNRANIKLVQNLAGNSPTTLLPCGTLTVKGKGTDLAEMFEMQNNGAVAFYDYKQAIDNSNLLKLALQYTSSFGGLIQSYPQEKTTAGHGMVNESEATLRLGLKGIPTLSEELQVARDLQILEYAGGNLHIPTVSTVGAIKHIKQAKEKGLQVSCSTTVHHLTIEDKALASFDSNYKVQPPLRSNKEVKALQKAVKSGVIDMVTSDHKPLTIELKAKEFSHATDGTIGLESAFGILNNAIGINATIQSLTGGYSAFAKAKTQELKEGTVANLTLFEPSTESIFSKKNILSTNINSAFIGMKTKGHVIGMINGKRSHFN